MTSGNNILKRNHKTKGGPIKIRFSGSGVSLIPLRYLCHLVNIRLIEVNFNDSQRIEVIFYHFYKRWEVIKFLLEPLCCGMPKHGFSKAEKTKTAVRLNHHICSPLSSILTSLKLHYISPSFSLQEEALCPGKWSVSTTFMLGRHGILPRRRRTTVMLGRHGIRCWKFIFFQLSSGK